MLNMFNININLFFIKFYFLLFNFYLTFCLIFVVVRIQKLNF